MTDFKVTWLLLLAGCLLKVSPRETQSLEVVSEDCDLDLQYFDRFEAKCRNCSEVMRIFEVGSSQDWQPLNSNNNNNNNNRDQQANTTPNGGQIKPSSSQAPDQPQESRIRTELISSALGSKLTPLPATSASGRHSTGGRRLAGGAPSDSTPSSSPQPARNRPIGRRQARRRDDYDQDEPDRERPDEWPAPLSSTNPIANSNNQLDLQQDENSNNNYNDNDDEGDQEQARDQRNLSRLAHKWQRLLMDFLSSHEIELVGLDSVEQCRANQNLNACQMWANICVMTMYSHSITGFNGQSQRQAPASAYTALRNLPGNSRRKSQIRSSDRRGGEPKMSWQQCAKFELTTFCNSLREWRRLERQSLDELGDIFGNEDDADGTLPTRLASTQSAPLKLGQEIQILAYEHAFDGRLLSISQFDLENLSEFCLFKSFASDRSGRADEPTRQRILVGQSMSLRCQFSASQANVLAPKHLNQTTFIDLFLGYQSNGATFLKPVPILLKNMLHQGQLVNMRHAKDSSRWKFVHRFFPMATIKLAAAQVNVESAKKPEREEIMSNGRNNNNSNGNIDRDQHEEEVLVFARSASFEIKLRRQQDKGLVINSMLLVLDYDHLSLFRDRPSSGQTTPKSSATSKAIPMHETLIQVNQFLSDMQNYRRDLDLFVTIVCITSTIWTLIKSYNIQKYQGLIKLDIHSLGLFMVVACDIVADLLVASTLCFILLLFALFKLAIFGDQMHSFAPDDELEQNLLLKLKLALLFKLVGFLYKLRIRLNADIFFIDWERPKMLTSAQLMSQQQQQQRPASDTKQRQADMVKPQAGSLAQNQISFWRPYTIINKWNQMQTLRRQNLTLQLVLFAALFKALKLDELSAAVPNSNVGEVRVGGVSPYEPKLAPRECATFRALILAIVYVTVATLQIATKRLLYEPMIRSTVREFVDLCSVANVSLFAMLYPRFGFYVHGRNANGSGDCGIVEMNVLLEREERDLCSRRGLMPNSDQQTFMMVLPKIVNDYYRKLLYRFDQANSVASSPIGFGRNGNKSQLKLQQQQQQPGEFIKTALSLSGSLSPVPSARSHPASFGSMRAHVESLAARNKAINAFLINFLDHAYKDIDYSVREQRPLASLLMSTDQSDEDETNQDSGQSKFGSRNIRNTNANLNRPLAINQTLADANQTVASLFVDSNNSFASLTWLGLEWDLMAIEMLLLLNLDLILGPNCLIPTLGLIWLGGNLFRSLYSTLARKNLINKAMLDEKFLARN